MQTGTTRTLIGLLILAGALFILNEVAVERFLYWRFWWYDIMMHLLGGVVIGGIAAWMQLRLFPAASSRTTVITVLASIVVVGVGWEIFEYLIDPTYAEQANIVFDTVLDLIMDMLGALAAALVITAIGRRRLLDVV